MTPIRYRDDDASLAQMFASIAVGALAGFAVGVVVAQKVGGISGIASRVRDRVKGLSDDLLEPGDVDDAFEDDDLDADDAAVAAEADEEATALEQRVLETFRADPVLSERAVDIGAVGDGIVELSGWVNSDDESEHAVALARTVDGVETVVNRLSTSDEEALLRENQERLDAGDDALRETRWEGQRVGTGRKRQGTSDDPHRHASPKLELESKWLDEAHALEAASESLDPGPARRGGRRPKSDPLEGPRGSGALEAPSGVPKGDHVADPEAAEQSAEQREQRAD